MPIAVDVAEEAEEALGIAEDEIAAGGAVGVAIESLTARADLRSERGQRVTAVPQRAELGFRPGEVRKHHNCPAELDANIGGEADRSAAGAQESKRISRLPG